MPRFGEAFFVARQQVSSIRQASVITQISAFLAQCDILKVTARAMAMLLLLKEGGRNEHREEGCACRR